MVMPVTTDRGWQPMLARVRTSACNPAPPLGSVAAKVRTMGGVCSGMDAFGSGLLRGGSAVDGPAVNIFIAHDVVLFQVGAALDFDDMERNQARIFKAMAMGFGNITGL